MITFDKNTVPLLRQAVSGPEMNAASRIAAELRAAASWLDGLHVLTRATAAASASGAPVATELEALEEAARWFIEAMTATKGPALAAMAADAKVRCRLDHVASQRLTRAEQAITGSREVLRRLGCELEDSRAQMIGARLSEAEISAVMDARQGSLADRVAQCNAAFAAAQAEAAVLREFLADPLRPAAALGVNMLAELEAAAAVRAAPVAAVATRPVAMTGAHA